ncbi:MAG: serine hydrolase [Ruminococcaceae bacterium]|nr:serine hydrolase [Oscillospiraceae bacterium]
MNKNLIKIIVFLLVICIAITAIYICIKNNYKQTKEIETVNKSETKKEAAKANINGDNPKETENKTNSLEGLKEEIQKEIENYDGEWAVYVEDLSNGDYIEINNKKMVSASLIKLFIMGKTYEEIEKGNMQEDAVEESLKSMITISDNEASNVLVAAIGGGKYTDMYSETFKKGLKEVNSYVSSLDFKNTEQQRDMKNSRPTPIPEQNYTSVSDCGKFLSKLYHKELVSETFDEKMLNLLKQQTRTSKIPRGLPEGTVCANKTGELSNVENDVAIVFSQGADYVICIMSNNVTNTAKARENITNISKNVYEFFNESL